MAAIRYEINRDQFIEGLNNLADDIKDALRQSLRSERRGRVSKRTGKRSVRQDGVSARFFGFHLARQLRRKTPWNLAFARQSRVLRGTRRGFQTAVGKQSPTGFPGPRQARLEEGADDWTLRLRFTGGVAQVHEEGRVLRPRKRAFFTVPLDAALDRNGKVTRRAAILLRRSEKFFKTRAGSRQARTTRRARDVFREANSATRGRGRRGGVGPRVFSSSSGRYESVLFPYESKSGKLFLALFQRGQLRLYFILVPKIQFPKRLAFRDSWKKYVPEAVKRVREGLKGALRAKAKSQRAKLKALVS